MFFYEFFSVIIYSDFADQQWTASNVDQILAEGDRLLYLDAFISRSIPDTETLSLYYLSREMRWSLDAKTMQIYIRQTNDSLQCRRLQVATIIKGWTVVGRTVVGRNFNVCDDHVISLEPVKRDWLIRFIKPVKCSWQTLKILTQIGNVFICGCPP